jgi:hypothetical protein
MKIHNKLVIIILIAQFIVVNISKAQFSIIHNGNNHSTITNFILKQTKLQFSDLSKIAEINLINDSINTIYDFQTTGCNQSNMYNFQDSIYYFMHHSSCQFNTILKSTNYGQTWQVKTTNSNDQQQLIMFNDTSGILSNNNYYVLQTTNSCASFDTLYQPNIIIAFNSNTYADSIATFYADNIYHFSKNRGLNWNTYNFGLGSKVFSTNFFNKDTFFVSGELFTQENPNSTNTKLYYSFNRGNTIDSLFMQIGSHIIYDMAFLGNNESYAVAYSLASQKNVILKTTDFFNTVQVIETPYSADNILLQKIKFVNDSIAYISDYYGKIIKWNKNHTNVGIQETESNKVLSIYPNPSTNQLTIQINSNFIIQNSKLLMYDILGNEVLNQTLKTQTTTLNIEHLTKGIYTIKISDVISTKQAKVILQ